MRKTFLLLIVFVCVINAEFLDDDMDGVENKYDLCPNSKITDIVDKNGCAIKTLKIKQKKSGDFDISFGFLRSVDDDFTSTSRSLAIGYKKEDLYISFYTSVFDLKDGKTFQDDSVVGLYYKLNGKIFDYEIGTGVYLPTYDDPKNKSDYFFQLKAFFTTNYFESGLLFKHIFVNDVGLKDIDSFSIWGGKNLYKNLSGYITYTILNSTYDKDTKYSYLAFSLNYDYKKWSFSFEYSKGLDSFAVDKSYSFLVGYHF